VEYFKEADAGVLAVAAADKMDGLYALRKEIGIAGKSVWEHISFSKSSYRSYCRAMSESMKQKNTVEIIRLETAFNEEIGRVFGE
jgi:hypothetical protein